MNDLIKKSTYAILLLTMKKISFLFLSLLLAGVLGANSAQALDFEAPEIKDAGYSAQYNSQSVADPIKLTVGQIMEVSIKFKNTGAKDWSASGYNYVSVYTINEKYRSSIFVDSGWLANNQPAKLIANTKVGQVGEFKIRLKAPNKIGSYKEDFYLAVENASWIKGGYFYLKIEVSAGATASVGNAVGATASQTASSFRFTSEMEAGDYGNQVSELQKLLTQTGQYKYGQITGTFGPITEQAVKNFQKDNKISPQSGVVGPLTLGALNKILTQEKPASIQPVSAPTTVEAIASAVAGESASSSKELIKEPNIKVGLYQAKGEVVFTSPYPYMVYAQKDYQVLLPPNTPAKLSYLNGQYIFKSSVWDFESDKNIRLVALEPNYYFTITNYTRTLSYRPNINYNSYHGNLELKNLSGSLGVYVINELPLDSYLAGIAETGNTSPPEYIKALLVAARSYAYVKINKTKTVYDRGFDVYASTVDQLYLGYTSEKELPNMAKQAEATFGELVTYQGEPVTTPYFGHSDGYTRSWSEAWGGTDKPWLKKVEAVYDHGQSMYGHGVGMSNRDASLRASSDGWDYITILKYYYTGVQVEKVY